MKEVRKERWVVAASVAVSEYSSAIIVMVVVGGATGGFVLLMVRVFIASKCRNVPFQSTERPPSKEQFLQRCATQTQLTTVCEVAYIPTT